MLIYSVFDMFSLHLFHIQSVNPLLFIPICGLTVGLWCGAPGNLYLVNECP